MKTLSKHIFAIISTVTLLAPLSALATENNATKLQDRPLKNNSENTKERSTTQRTTTQANVFCQRILASSGKLREIANKNQTEFSDKRQEQVDKLRGLAKKRDEKIDGRREEWDARRENQFEKLDGSSTTDAQKAAVAAFKATIEAAIKTRRAAVDSALEAFRKGMEALVKEHQDSVKAAINNLKTAGDAAYAKAKADCEAGVDPATVKAELKTALDAARATFQTEMKNRDKSKEEVAALIKARNEAIKKAVDDFKAAAEKARQTLKTALGTTTTTPTTP